MGTVARGRMAVKTVDPLQEWVGKGRLQTKNVGRPRKSARRGKRKRRGERASAPTWRTVTTVAATATRKETPRKKNARKRRRERNGGRIKHRHGPPLRGRFRMNTRRGRLSPTRVGTWRVMTRFIFSIFRGGIEKGRISSADICFRWYKYTTIF